MHALWIAMAGSTGVGKSTLAGRLAEHLQGGGQTAEVCGEDELFNRPVFAEIARGFTTKEFADPERFEVAYSA